MLSHTQSTPRGKLSLPWMLSTLWNVKEVLCTDSEVKEPPSCKGMAFSIVFLQIGIIYHFLYPISTDCKQCKVEETATPSLVFIVDIPMAFVFTAIILGYIIVIIRFIKRTNRVNALKLDNSNNSDAIDTGSGQGMRRNVKTLGIVIIITLMARIPRSVMSFYSLYTGPVESTLTVLFLCNVCLILKPLFDPIIDVLCVTEFREGIRSLCNKVFGHNL